MLSKVGMILYGSLTHITSNSTHALPAKQLVCLNTLKYLLNKQRWSEGGNLEAWPNKGIKDKPSKHECKQSLTYCRLSGHAINYPKNAL